MCRVLGLRIQVLLLALLIPAGKGRNLYTAQCFKKQTVFFKTETELDDQLGRDEFFALLYGAVTWV